MNLKLKVLMIGIIMSILIGGCVEETQHNDISVNTPTSTPFFPQQKENPAIFMDALLVGELVLEDDCLSVGDDLLVWPHGFSLSTEDGVIQIIDDNDQPIMRVGDKIKLGGGEMSREHIAKYSAELPSDCCSGPYWIVGEVITSD
jgi:hypothetical protein